MVEYTGWKPALTAALSKIGETIAVEQITLTAPLAYTLPEGVPSGVVHNVVFTQNNVGGHTVTYGAGTDGAQAPIRTEPSAATIVKLYPIGGSQWMAYSDSPPAEPIVDGPATPT